MLSGSRFLPRENRPTVLRAAGRDFIARDTIPHVERFLLVLARMAIGHQERIAEFLVTFAVGVILGIAPVVAVLAHGRGEPERPAHGALWSASLGVGRR